jgi:hypothetical protein
MIPSSVRTENKIRKLSYLPTEWFRGRNDP